MQIIRIIISGGKAQSVEISDALKRKSKKSIPDLLRSMPKSLLAKALGIPPGKEDSSDV